MKKTVLILLSCLLAASLGGLSLREAFESAAPGVVDGVAYDKVVELDTGEAYYGGLYIGPMFDQQTSSWWGEPGQDVCIVGAGALIDLQGQQITIAYCNNRLDIQDCVILNGGVRFNGHCAETPLIPTGSVRYCTFYKPHDYAVRLQSAGAGIVIEHNISVSPVDTGCDFSFPSGQTEDWLPTGSSFAFSAQSELFGTPVFSHNWSYHEDPARNAQALMHASMLCDNGSLAPSPWIDSRAFSSGNVFGVDPELVDPDNWNFVITPHSPAQGYGCRMFTRMGKLPPAPPPPPPPPPLSPDDPTFFAVGGVIDVDTWWVADTIRVTEDVTILDGVTLWIDLGVRVEFDEQTTLHVQGRLWAVGEPNAPIVFDSTHPELFTPDESLAGSWGGVRFHNTSSINVDSQLEWCVLTHGKSLGDTRGGVISALYFSELAMYNCTVTDNMAACGGAMYFAGGAAPTINNCIIANNRALEAGGAIYCDFAYPRIELSTIAGNDILHNDASLPTSTLHFYISKPQLTGNIVWDNYAPHIDGGQMWMGKPYYTRWCDIQDGYEGEGCIGDDPLFADRSETPWSLQTGSPCIDAGPPVEMLYRQPLIDSQGQQRWYGAFLDMGACESQPLDVDDDNAPVVVQQMSLYPNPFNPELTCRFSLASPSQATVEVYNVRGRRVAVLADQSLPAGEHAFVWDGRDQAGAPTASGVYLVRLRTPGVDTAQRAVLLK